MRYGTHLMNPCKLVNTNTMAVGLYRGQLESHAMRRPLIRAGSRWAPVHTVCPRPFRGLWLQPPGTLLNLSHLRPRGLVSILWTVYKLVFTKLWMQVTSIHLLSLTLIFKHFNWQAWADWICQHYEGVYKDLYSQLYINAVGGTYLRLGKYKLVNCS